MHTPPFHQPGGGRRLWLIAGTGEGPPLARLLLQRGWRLKVSVVSREAIRAYLPHPELELAVGALAGAQGVAAELERAARTGDAFAWVIDASHPFACRISASLAEACGACDQGLLRLRRPLLPVGSARLLDDLVDLERHCCVGEPLLLAIGARQLAAAVHHSPAALHHARILPQPAALQQAMAAGLAPQRVACLRPGGEAAIERALCRQWGIRSVLCRQSGGVTETHWRELCGALDLQLLLLRRPGEPPGGTALRLDGLIERLGEPPAQR
jgi:precorrin-6A/cobalt-precorrin-6A reductase